MRTTLRQQANAVRKARATAPKKLAQKLNDAASTLVAVALIGEKKVLLADELYRAVKNFIDLTGFDNEAYIKMRAVVKRIEDEN